ncbi:MULTISPECIES: hypothetical protein [Gordonia]|uniref:Uncharacterized protein n=1 Tax=Gordonia sihwensis NBRC 108236 TaxID=1223544 RepID=L7LML5_9ACTN|nr:MULTISPECIES: hypothetical protein [Gordonia]AUH69676.1 hypothetical protein CXX93_16815 [Gordonia sp. YC-JH1]GAC62114.1 hypothetical protein GSI01S_29_00020 [Gordonia sihwensis NBRC 108236]
MLAKALHEYTSGQRPEHESDTSIRVRNTIDSVLVIIPHTVAVKPDEIQEIVNEIADYEKQGK